MNEYRTNALVDADFVAERREERQHQLDLAKARATATKARWDAIREVMPYCVAACVLAAGVTSIVYLGVYDSGRDAGRRDGHIQCLEGKR